MRLRGAAAADRAAASDNGERVAPASRQRPGATCGNCGAGFSGAGRNSTGRQAPVIGSRFIRTPHCYSFRAVDVRIKIAAAGTSNAEWVCRREDVVDYSLLPSNRVARKFVPPRYGPVAEGRKAARGGRRTGCCGCDDREGSSTGRERMYTPASTSRLPPLRAGDADHRRRADWGGRVRRERPGPRRRGAPRAAVGPVERMLDQRDQRSGARHRVARVHADDRRVGAERERVAHLVVREGVGGGERVDRDDEREVTALEVVDRGKQSSTRRRSTRTTAPTAPRAARPT